MNGNRRSSSEMKKWEYILSQHKVIHKVKKYTFFQGEVVCKCGYHGYDYEDIINLENWHKCKMCFREKKKITTNVYADL